MQSERHALDVGGGGVASEGQERGRVEKSIGICMLLNYLLFRNEARRKTAIKTLSENLGRKLRTVQTKINAE